MGTCLVGPDKREGGGQGRQGGQKPGGQGGQQGQGARRGVGGSQPPKP